jgi:hypothetical protein
VILVSCYAINTTTAVTLLQAVVYMDEWSTSTRFIKRSWQSNRTKSIMLLTRYRRVQTEVLGGESSIDTRRIIAIPAKRLFHDRAVSEPSCASDATEAYYAKLGWTLGLHSSLMCADACDTYSSSPIVKNIRHRRICSARWRNGILISYDRSFVNYGMHAI